MSNVDTQKIFSEARNRWRYDCYAFATEVLGVKPVDYKKVSVYDKRATQEQKDFWDALSAIVLAKSKLALGKDVSEVERALAKKFGISIRSGKGTGKTMSLAVSVIWFLFFFPQSKILCTAAKMDQIKDVLWNEISKWVLKSRENVGDLISSEIEILSEKIYMKKAESGIQNWYAIARTATMKSGEGDPAGSLRGHHAKYMLIIADEASMIPEPVFETLVTTMTDAVNLMVMTFNPHRNSGFAFQSHHSDKENWHLLHWDGEFNENVAPESIQRLVKKYGRDSAAFQVSVKGNFPTMDKDSLIPLEWIMQAVNKYFYVDDTVPKFSAVDVAGEGTDSSYIATRQGPVFADDCFTKYSGPDTVYLTGMIIDHINEVRPKGIGLDSVGMGYPIYRSILSAGYPIKDIHVNRTPRDKSRFFRLRDELWWELRTKFEVGEISIPNDEELIFELASIRYKQDVKIKVEGKKEMRARGLESPDKADAVMMTYYFKDSAYTGGSNRLTIDLERDSRSTRYSWMGV